MLWLAFIEIVARDRVLCQWLGFHPGETDGNTLTLRGPNTIATSSTLDNVQYRLFDQTRIPAKFTAPAWPEDVFGKIDLK